MQKSSLLSFFTQQVGLRMSPTKTEVMTLNITNPTPITVDGVNLPLTEEFMYFSIVVWQDGGAGTDIQSRLSKARNFAQITQQCLEVDSVQNPLQTTTLPELRAVSPPLWSRVLENDSGGS